MSYFCSNSPAIHVGSGAQPPSAFTDDFNRADQNLEASANWTHDGLIAGAVAIRSNALANLTTDASGSAYKCSDQGSADHYVQFTARATANSGPFVCNRLADRLNFIGVRNSGVNLEVYRRVAGTLTLLHQSNQGIVSGTIIRLECEGANGRVYVSGNLVLSGDLGAPTLTSTRQGVVGRTTTAGQNPWIDNFEAGAL